MGYLASRPLGMGRLASLAYAGEAAASEIPSGRSPVVIGMYGCCQWCCASGALSASEQCCSRVDVRR
jgi:hypothetical protein